MGLAAQGSYSPACPQRGRPRARPLGKGPPSREGENVGPAGVETIFLEAEGNIHGFINLRKAIPSSNRDIARAVAALKRLIAGVQA